MKRTLSLRLVAFLLVPAVAHADEGRAVFHCDGVASFSGEIALRQDRRAAVPGVERTYFGSTAVNDERSNTMVGLVQLLIGHNRADGDEGGAGHCARVVCDRTTLNRFNAANYESRPRV